MNERLASGARTSDRPGARWRRPGPPVDRGTAWDDPRIRQRLSQLYIDCEAMQLTRLPAPTRQIRGGRRPGLEGSILKLAGSSSSPADRPA